MRFLRYIIILTVVSFINSGCHREHSAAGSEFKIVNPSGSSAIGTTTGANNKIGGNSNEAGTYQYQSANTSDSSFGNNSQFTRQGISTSGSYTTTTSGTIRPSDTLPKPLPPSRPGTTDGRY